MQSQKLLIRETEDRARGFYANFMAISHNKEEFRLDFANIFGTVGYLNARILVSPGHLKRMKKAIDDNLEKYEREFKGIEVAADPGNGKEIGFNPNRGD